MPAILKITCTELVALQGAMKQELLTLFSLLKTAAKPEISSKSSKKLAKMFLKSCFKPRVKVMDLRNSKRAAVMDSLTEIVVNQRATLTRSFDVLRISPVG